MATKYKTKATISKGKYWYCRHAIPCTHLLTLFYSWIFIFLLFPFYTIFFDSFFFLVLPETFFDSHSWLHMHSITCISIWELCLICKMLATIRVWSLNIIPFAQMRYNFNLKFEWDEHLLCRIISGCKKKTEVCTSTAHRDTEWYK